MFLVRLIDRMNLIKIKRVHILSNGSLVFFSESYFNDNLFYTNEKDYKNFFLFKKRKNKNLKKLNTTSKYKNKYLF